MRLGRRLLLPGFVLASVVAPALTGCGLLDLGGSSTLDDATEYLPADTFRVRFVDRAAMAERLGVDDIDPRSVGDGELDDYIEALDPEASDVLATTELTAYLGAMRNAPFNDLDIEWEAYAAWGDDPSDPSGEAFVWKVGDDLDFDDLADDLVGKGYAEEGSGDLALYEADPDTVDGTNTYSGVYPTQMTGVLLDEDDQLIAASYATEPLDEIADVIGDDADSLADDGSMDRLLGAAEDDPELAALSTAGPSLCSSTEAPVPEQLRGQLDDLGTPSGRGFFFAGDDALPLVALTFDSEEAAEDDAAARETLVAEGVDTLSARPFDELGDFEVSTDGTVVLIEEDFEGGPRQALQAESSGGGPGMCLSPGA